MTTPQAGSSARIEEQAYDDAPYESHPYAQSHPARMAAIAQVFGLTPPPVETARVLELGCASGGNLIPLAAHFPKAQFTGVDISGKQIAEGHRRISQLGLQNIELRHAGIESLTPGDGKFDYIICHGIYSWVPEPVRDALLRVCDQNLSDHGVAFVSYNTLPGWHFVHPTRDLMMYATESIADPQERVRTALTLLNDIKNLAEDVSGRLHGKEAENLQSQHASYVLHDHLEQVNAPCYLKDFVAHAQLHALAYLSDSSFKSFNPLATPPMQLDLIEKYAGGDIVRAEQYLDFLRRTRFRQSLLVKREQQEKIDRTAPLTRLDLLHFRIVGTITRAPAPPASMAATWWCAGLAVYRLGTVTITPRSTTASSAMDWLAINVTSAATFTLQRLANEVLTDTGDVDRTEGKRLLAELLWDLIDTHSVRVYSCALNAPAPAAGTPGLATPLARADAALERFATSNSFHESTPLNETRRKLLGLLDGQRTSAQLADAMGPDFSAESIDKTLDQLRQEHLLC